MFSKARSSLTSGAAPVSSACLLPRLGQKKVIRGDRNNIIDKAQRIVRKNGFTEDQITLIKGRLEDIQLPAEVSTVDAIVSERMGYALYF